MNKIKLESYVVESALATGEAEATGVGMNKVGVSVQIL